MAQTAWAQARAASDFSIFQPHLEKIIRLKRKEAEYVGYKESPYDALIDEYEPGMTAKKAEMILENLKDFLVLFLTETLKRQKNKNMNVKKIIGNFPISEQMEFNAFVAEKMGYDFEAGRIDASIHPFTTEFHPQDVRITTRYDMHNVLYALGSTIHETGHALYEQGLPAEHYGTALGQSISLGIHESQSRMWENMIGKSPDFWKYFYPKLQKKFPVPFRKISLHDFCEIINRVKPTFIRTEADEVTYNLHIIMRFEIERDLIEGRLKVTDAPRVWNDKVQKYLGIKVLKDSEGILQDVHWSAGLIGYFPTYAFGNLYAAQFFHTMSYNLPIKQLLSKGDLKPIRQWLLDHIHMHGKKFTAEALVKEVTGEALNSSYFTDYLKTKYK